MRVIWGLGKREAEKGDVSAKIITNLESKYFNVCLPGKMKEGLATTDPAGFRSRGEQP